MKVQKSGRTTGWTQGAVDLLGVTVNVNYAPSGAPPRLARFDNQFRVTARTGAFSDRGDSGSLVTTEEDNHPVGLLFAGGDTVTGLKVTFCNHIGLVLDTLEVEIHYWRHEGAVSADAPALGLIRVWRLFAHAGAPCYAWLAAGVAVLLFASSLAADGQFEDADDMAIEKVLERQREALMRRPEAIGVGIGERAGKPAIVLMVKRITPEALAGLPAEIDGHPLIVEEVGEITAYWTPLGALRSVAWFQRTGAVAVRLRRIAAQTIVPGARLDGAAIAVLRPPLTVDNLEGVAARRGAAGETLLYLVSDDNFRATQRTLLLLFALAE